MIGPLTFEQDGKTYLVGVASFIFPGCPASAYPGGGYARITEVLEWIDEVGVGENGFYAYCPDIGFLQ